MAYIEVVRYVSHLTQGGERWAVEHDGEILVKSCRSPCDAAARALLDLGADLDDTLIVLEPGGMVCMRGRIGSFAAITTTEGQSSGPRFIRFVPHPGRPGVDDED